MTGLLLLVVLAVLVVRWVVVNNRSERVTGDGDRRRQIPAIAPRAVGCGIAKPTGRADGNRGSDYAAGLCPAGATRAGFRSRAES